MFTRFAFCAAFCAFFVFAFAHFTMFLRVFGRRLHAHFCTCTYYRSGYTRFVPSHAHAVCLRCAGVCGMARALGGWDVYCNTCVLFIVIVMDFVWFRALVVWFSSTPSST